ncbi:DUF2147 domain-containing protein [Antarcticibacterium sp. 1MA-6-2]|uniref:DUF2147 domain-containing protein n=1 Tax=Antarcticibacterium sp. 1MA-6-2 TaxID=2908210 RepID=UPI001F31688B|nr:DUF2147 domain-containing protein [Antarcticibacterium sp. 1MA-6-2]UJH91468.1 DUF2147 domain-containing protein [Antarcticibacterium sp. 1MA-6-2]
MKRTLTILFLFVLGGLQAQTIFGKWKTRNDETGKPNSIIEIYKEGDEINGKVVKILKESDRDRICENCEGELKNKPVEGLELMTGLKQKDDEFSGGIITDPETGKEYRVKVWLDENNPNLLKVRGYIAFFYRTQTWERVQ